MTRKKESMARRSLPKITLKSPPSDVLKTADGLLVLFKEWSRDNSGQIMAVGTGRKIGSIEAYHQDAMLYLHMVCDWLRENRPDLYDALAAKCDETMGRMERTDAAIAAMTGQEEWAAAGAECSALNNAVSDLVEILRDTAMELAAGIASGAATGGQSKTRDSKTSPS
jgi:hypothetical protein